MGHALTQRFPEAADTFREADDALGFSLSQLCFEGPAEALAQTANTQPAILTTSIAVLRVLEERTAVRPDFVMGHSLGEFSALVAAGALSFRDAVKLVRLRGQAMQEAVPSGVGGMVAVIGKSSDEVEAMCRESAQGQVLSPANENGGGQIVCAGHHEAVQRLIVLAKAQKARAIALNVSAPFHCSLMQPAADRVEQALRAIEIAPLAIPVISNVDAEPNREAARVAGLLVRQVTSRVRWEASVQRALALGVDQAVEVGHGKVLAGLVRRIDRSVSVRPIGSPDDIDVLNGGGDGS